MEDLHKIKVGITHGDINGIGYEVILKALSDPRIVELCTPIVYGSSKIASFHRKALDLAPLTFNIIDNGRDAVEGRLNLVNCIDEDVKVEFSQSTRAAGMAAIKSLDGALKELKEGNIDVLVTAPINKNNIQSETFSFPGHTEYLEQVAGEGDKSLMILLNDDLKVALVTNHLPVKDISKI